MKVDYGLILSAGMGTRMGEVGRILPKPLWPIFERRLLDCQVQYLKEFQLKSIYANIFSQKDKVFSYWEKSLLKDDLNLLIEDELLDIGGAIHNLAKKNEIKYNGKLMVTSCDQFLLLESEILNEAMDFLDTYPTVLIGIEVNGDSDYNELLIDEDNLLIKIIPNKEREKKKRYITYSGLCFINLAKLSPKIGKSGFFESVCNYRDMDVKVKVISDFEYWDFGTIERYRYSMFSLLKQLKEEVESIPSSKKVKFLDFCLRNQIIDKNKLVRGEFAYGCTNSSHLINLSKREMNAKNGGDYIVLEDLEINFLSKSGIYYKNAYDPF